MISILDRRFQYVPAFRTNIMDRSRAAGFVPPSEQRKRQPDELQRLRQLRWDLDLMAIFTKDGKTVVMDAERFEAAMARADGCWGVPVRAHFPVI